MKAKVDGVSKNAQKPMEQFSVEEVQNWFETFQGGIFKNYAAKFQNLNVIRNVIDINDILFFSLNKPNLV